MIGTTWKGGTFGIRVGSANALQYFNKKWTHIEVKLGNTFHVFNLSKTFWTTCPEFRGKEIGIWLHMHGLDHWPKGRPHKIKLIPLGSSKFKLLKEMPTAPLKLIFSRTTGHCHFCGDPLAFFRRGMRKGQPEEGSWEIDHVIQKDKGGRNSADNYLPACVRCNRLRWHRKGEQLRELLLLGLIAKGEIQNATSIGRHLSELVTKRVATNKRRRLRKEALS